VPKNNVLIHDVALEALTLGPEAPWTSSARAVPISMRTVSPETSRKRAARHAANGSWQGAHR
jgi:3-hydroxyisobutyrate dehydrogenase-like beta-hydroxyacid dehydrogenase